MNKQLRLFVVGVAAATALYGCGGGGAAGGGGSSGSVPSGWSMVGSAFFPSTLQYPSAMTFDESHNLYVSLTTGASVPTTESVAISTIFSYDLSNSSGWSQVGNQLSDTMITNLQFNQNLYALSGMSYPNRNDEESLSQNALYVYTDGAWSTYPSLDNYFDGGTANQFVVNDGNVYVNTLYNGSLLSRASTDFSNPWTVESNSLVNTLAGLNVINNTVYQTGYNWNYPESGYTLSVTDVSENEQIGESIVIGSGILAATILGESAPEFMLVNSNTTNYQYNHDIYQLVGEGVSESWVKAFPTVRDAGMVGVNPVITLSTSGTVFMAYADPSSHVVHIVQSVPGSKYAYQWQNITTLPYRELITSLVYVPNYGLYATLYDLSNNETEVMHYDATV